MEYLMRYKVASFSQYFNTVETVFKINTELLKYLEKNLSKNEIIQNIFTTMSKIWKIDESVISFPNLSYLPKWLGTNQYVKNSCNNNYCHNRSSWRNLENPLGVSLEKCVLDGWEVKQIIIMVVARCYCTTFYKDPIMG